MRVLYHKPGGYTDGAQNIILIMEEKLTPIKLKTWAYRTVSGCSESRVGVKQIHIGTPAPTHIWELPGNYHDFIVVMVFYLFCQRTKRILVTVITGFKIYILIQSLMLFISENNRVILF